MIESVFQDTAAPAKLQLSDVETARFWAKVDRRGPDECWLWIGAKKGHGYGRFKHRRAHRVSFELHHRLLALGECVLHRCDVPSCCNPKHLWAGSQQENMADMLKKGRHGRGAPRGEKHGVAKLTENQVLMIRARYANGGITQKSLATEIGIDQTLVSMIVMRKIWRHI